MKDFPTCFGENAIQIDDTSCSSATKVAQNIVTCIYQCTLHGQLCLVTITWSKNLMGQQCVCLDLVDDSSKKRVCKFDIKPWLFSKRKGSSKLNSCRIELHWDFSAAKFGPGPEPLEDYYLAVVSNGEMILLVGGMRGEAFKKTNANPIDNNSIFISKRDHIFGKKKYCSKAQFCESGQIHDITIECDTTGGRNPCLMIRVDGNSVVNVKRLRWKFRGNQTILIDGLSIEVFWDVHNWLFSTCIGSAVFMFQTRISDEKIWTSPTFFDPFLSPWNYSSRKSSRKEPKLQDLGFSLILYAWKNE